MFRNQKILFGVAGIVVFAGLLIFRVPLSQLLHRGGSREDAREDLVTQSQLWGGLATPSPRISGGPSVVLPPSGTAVAPIPTSTPIPPYQGRSPDEVRPAESEVATLAQGEREKIYGEIRMHARAVTEQPDFLFGWIQLGLSKKTIGDYEGARDAWEYASIIRPLNVVSFANLGELYWRYLPDYPRAERNFRTAIKNKPDDLPNYVSLSELYGYSYQEKQELADDALLEGIAANPQAVDLFRALAHLYGMQKQYIKAIEWWEKVLVHEPDNAVVKDEIARLKQQLAAP